MHSVKANGYSTELVNSCEEHIAENLVDDRTCF